MWILIFNVLFIGLLVGIIVIFFLVINVLFLLIIYIELSLFKEFLFLFIF